MGWVGVVGCMVCGCMVHRWEGLMPVGVPVPRGAATSSERCSLPDSQCSQLEALALGGRGPPSSACLPSLPYDCCARGMHTAFGVLRVAHRLLLHELLPTMPHWGAGHGCDAHAWEASFLAYTRPIRFVHPFRVNVCRVWFRA